MLAKLFIDLKVSGCRSPSTSFLTFNTVWLRSSASLCRPREEYVKAKLFIDVKVSGCRSPSTSFLSIQYSLVEIQRVIVPSQGGVRASQVVHRRQGVWMSLPKHILPRIQYSLVEIQRVIVPSQVRSTCKAKLFIDVKVSGCRSPSTSFLAFNTVWLRSSASLCRPR